MAKYYLQSLDHRYVKWKERDYKAIKVENFDGIQEGGRYILELYRHNVAS